MSAREEASPLSGKKLKKSEGRKKGQACPICGKPRSEAIRPFCSKHCADIDLARWLDGRYAIPGKQTDDDEADSPAPKDEE